MPQYDGVPVNQRVAIHLDAMRGSFLDDKPTPDQERLLTHLDSISRKPTAVRDMLNNYAALVANEESENQADIFSQLGESGRLTRESLFDRLFGPAQPQAQQGGLFG
jgi:hypothetical protein